MPSYRIREVADLLGVSDDTVRRWIDGGRLDARTDDGRAAVDGAELAAFAQERATSGEGAFAPTSTQSARNRLVGLVVNVTRDTVMAQVELQCGPHRIVSLMSREAADDLGLEPGVLAAAVVKSTNVLVEVPNP